MFSSYSSSSSSSSISFLKPPSKKALFPTRISASFSATTENRATLTMASSSVSPYEVLGISLGATSQEIKAAYRKLARTCHPDVVGMKEKETSASEFMKIHSAYSTLSDPCKRAQYDREIRRRKLEYSPLTSKNLDSMSGYAYGCGYGRKFASQSGMKWETDQCW